MTPSLPLGGAGLPALLALTLPALLGTVCQRGEDWTRFNADDRVEVQVTATGTEPGPAVETNLTSTTGGTVVGSAEVDPGSGPVGTDHQVWVRVADAWEDTVTRVSVEIDSGERGVETFELERDSADHGLWWLQIASEGAEGETRTDTFEFQLWEPGEDTAADTGG